MKAARLGCHRGRGLAKALLHAAERAAIERGRWLLVLDTAVDEGASGLYERVGFRPEGVMRKYERGPDGEWHDGLLRDMLAEELRD